MKALSIVIGILMVLAIAVPIQTLAWGNGHPDTCVYCHGPYGTTTDTINGTSYVFWNHNIQTGHDPNTVDIWQNCYTSGCHTNYVQGTVHSGLGCQGCHAVAHIGYYDGTNYAVGLYYWELSNPTNKIVIAPNAANLQWKSLKLDSTNASTYIPDITTYVGTQGMEVEVGVWDAFNNQFKPVSGAGQDPIAKTWTVCFSCHFIVQDPASIGSYMIVDGKWKIGIPAAALEMDPHYIYPISPESTTTESGSGLPIFTIGLGIVGIALVVAARHKLA